MKCNIARASLFFTENFTESIQQMIDDGELESEEDVKNCIRDYLVEDLQTYVGDGYNGLLNKFITFEIEIEQE